MRVREYNIISHSKLPAIEPSKPRGVPVINNDHEYLSMRRTLSQNTFSRAGKSSHVFERERPPGLKLPFQEAKDMMKEQKQFNVNFQYGHSGFVWSKICPRCYDSGIDDEEGNANQACISCEVKECQHSSAANYLMDCKSCDMGQIILTNTAKHELVAICNNSKCYQGYRLGENVNTVNVLELDEKLGYHKLKITFTKNNKKRADKPFEGFVFDDEEYKKEVLDLGQFIFGSGSLTAGNNSQKKRSNFSGRGGRGRGRGGRGRGGRH